LRNEFYPRRSVISTSLNPESLYGQKKTCLRVVFIFASILFILGIPVDGCVCAFSIESAFRIIVDGFEVACASRHVVLIIEFKRAREINSEYVK